MFSLDMLLTLHTHPDAKPLHDISRRFALVTHLYDRVYRHVGVPVADDIFGSGHVLVERSRKILLSTSGCKAQYHHLDSTTPMIVLCMYLHTTAAQVAPTKYFRSGRGENGIYEVAELNFSNQVCARMYEGSWYDNAQHPILSPPLVSNGSVGCHVSTIIHAGPKVESSGIRICLFQTIVHKNNRLSLDLDADLESQTFEFSFLAQSNPTNKSLLSACLRRHPGWRNHYPNNADEQSPQWDPFYEKQVLESAIARKRKSCYR